MRRPVRHVMSTTLTAGIAVGLTGFLLAACGDGDDGGGGGSEERSSAAVLEQGRDVYETHCATCHGRNGEGASGPALNEGRVLVRFPDPEAHILLVENGSPPMPPFKGRLSREEIEAVVAYEREGFD